MDNFEKQNQEILLKIFFSKIFLHQNRIKEENKRFVHYTTAESAYKIIESKKVFLRNTKTMNDFSEVQHGIDCLIETYNNSDVGHEFRELLEKIHPGITKKLEGHFNGWQPSFKNQSFIFSISEHEDNEDSLGRLSMWRAYGKGTGVALVLNSFPFLQENDHLSAYTVKVEYISSDDYSKSLRQITDGLIDNFDLIKSLSEDHLIRIIFDVFKFTALSAKHKGFSEEQEWRVIYNPELEPSNYIDHEVHILNGLPQEVHCIKLQNIPEINLMGTEVSEILDRIIIGPSDYADTIYKAFEYLLKGNGISNPREKIFISSIPLR